MAAPKVILISGLTCSRVPYAGLSSVSTTFPMTRSRSAQTIRKRGAGHSRSPGAVRRCASSSARSAAADDPYRDSIERERQPRSIMGRLPEPEVEIVDVKVREFLSADTAVEKSRTIARSRRSSNAVPSQALISLARLFPVDRVDPRRHPGVLEEAGEEADRVEEPSTVRSERFRARSAISNDSARRRIVPTSAAVRVSIRSPLPSVSGWLYVVLPERRPGSRKRISDLGKWRRADSNRRPPACKAGALPTELRPHVYLRKHPTASLAQIVPPRPPPYQQSGRDGRNYPGLLQRWRAPGQWVETSDGSDSRRLDPRGVPRA